MWEGIEENQVIGLIQRKSKQIEILKSMLK